MSWNQSRALYLDINSPGGEDCLLIVDSDAVSRQSAPVILMQRDVFELRLHFRDDSTGTWETAELPAGSAVKVAARKASDTSGDILFSAVSFSLVDTGDPNAHYAGDLSLNTTEIETELESATYVDVHVDVEVQNSGNTKRTTYRIRGRITKDIYDDAAGAPTTPGVYSSSGTDDISNGVNSHSIDWSALGLVSPPSQILVSIRMPTSSSDLVLAPAVDHSSVTASGCDVYFPATIPATGYKLDWFIIL